MFYLKRKRLSKEFVVILIFHFTNTARGLGHSEFSKDEANWLLLREHIFSQDSAKFE